MVLQSLWGLPLRHQQHSHQYRHHHHQHYIPRMSVVMASYFFDDAVLFFFFFLSRTLLNLYDTPLVFYLRYCSTGYHAEENSSLHILQYSSFVERIPAISAENAVPSKVKQSNGTFCIQVREISCYLLLIIKSLNNMKETTSRWIQITVIPFLSKKCTFGTDRVSVLEICLSYKVLKMTGQKKRRD